jgi:hypothetical protein
VEKQIHVFFAREEIQLGLAFFPLLLIVAIIADHSQFLELCMYTLQT